MPTFFIVFGLRFFIYSEEHLPVHVHVQKGRAKAKFTLESEIELFENKGLKVQELSLAKSIIEENREIIIAEWKKHLDKKKR